MDIPECENVPQGRCPKSDVAFMAEHGTLNSAVYWTFRCRTCDGWMIRFNPQVVAAAKKGALDRQLMKLVGGSPDNPRFKGRLEQ
jgi:hypothetical protein